MFVRNGQKNRYHNPQVIDGVQYGPEWLADAGRRAELNILPCVEVVPQYDPYTQVVTELLPVLVGGLWTQQWKIADLSLTPVQQAAALAQAKADRIRECDLLAKEKREALTATIAPGEMASWPIKRAEALAYQASGNAADAPNLAVEAETRQIALVALVEKVLSKAAQLSYIEAQLAGVNGLHNDAISALETTAEVVAYDIKAGWPV